MGSFKGTNNRPARPALFLLLLVLLMVSGAFLSSCGGSGDRGGGASPGQMHSQAMDSAAGESASPGMAPENKGDGAPSPARPYGQDVKLIFRAWLTLEATDFDKAAETLDQLVADCGGYYETSEVNTGGRGSDSRFGYYVVRIPQNKYSGFLNKAGDAGHALSLRETAEDVGSQYFDTESRLKTLRIKQERLQKLMQSANKMEDIISLENALSDVQQQIEQHQSQLNRYDGLIGFATIEISLSQVVRLTDSTTDQDPLGARMSLAFRQGLRNVGDVMENLAVGLAYSFIPLALIVILLICAFLVARRRRMRGKGKAEDRPDKKDE